MAYDDDLLPRAVLRDENLYIEGEDEPYFRDTGYIDLEVTDLRISGGCEDFRLFDTLADQHLAKVSLHGRVKLVGEDKFAVAGEKTDPCVPVDFSLWRVGRK